MTATVLLSNLLGSVAPVAYTLTAGTAAFSLAPSSLTPKVARKVSLSTAAFSFAPSAATLSEVLPTPTFRSDGGYNYSTGGAAVVLTKPPGTAVGDLLLMQIGIVAFNNSVTIPTPSGWNYITDVLPGINSFSGYHRLYLFYRIATSADVSASTYTIAGAGTIVGLQGNIRGFYNTAQVNPINSFASTAITASQNQTVPALSETFIPGELAVLVSTNGQQNGWAAFPSPYADSLYYNSGFYDLLAIIDYAPTSTPAAQVVSWAGSNNGVNDSVSIQLTIKPASAPTATAYSLSAATASFGFTLSGITPKVARKASLSTAALAYAPNALMPKVARKLSLGTAGFSFTANSASLSAGSAGYIATGTQANDGSTGTLILTKPAGTTTGDLILAVVQVFFASSSATPPSGWSTAVSVGATYKLYVFWKIAGASEPTTYTFTTTTFSEGNTRTYRGYGAINGTSSFEVDSGTVVTYTLPAVTETFVSGERYVVFGTSYNGYQWTTESPSLGNLFFNSGTYISLNIGDVVLGSAPGIQTLNWNAGDSSLAMLGVVIKPVVAPVGYTLLAATAAFATTISALTPKVARKISLNTAALSLAPNAVAAKTGRQLALATAGFTLAPSSTTSTVRRKAALASAAFGLTPSALTPGVGRKLLAATAGLSFTPSSIAPAVGRSIGLGSAAFGLTVSAATGGTGRRISANAAAFGLTASAIVPKVARKLPLATASFGLAPNNITIGFGLIAGTAAFSLAPSGVTGAISRKIIAAKAAFGLTPSALKGTAGRNLPAATAAFSLAPSSIVPKVARKLSLAAVTFGVTPSALTPTTGRALGLATASFNFSPGAVNFSLTTVGRYTLSLGTVVFGLAPSGLTGAVGRKLPAATASFALAPSALQAATGRTFTAGTAAFSFTPSGIVGKTGRKLPAQTATFALAISAARPSTGRALRLAAVSFGLAPSEATGATGRALAVDTAALSFAPSGIVARTGRKLLLARVSFSFAPSAAVFALDAGAGISGAMGAVEDPDAFDGAGGIAAHVALAATEGPDLAAAQGNVTWAAAMAASEAPDLLNASGEVYQGVTIAAVEDADNAHALGQVYDALAMDAVEDGDVAAFAASVITFATMDALEDEDVFIGWDHRDAILAEGDAVEDPDNAAIVGSVYIAAALETVEAGDLAAFSVNINLGGVDLMRITIDETIGRPRYYREDLEVFETQAPPVPDGTYKPPQPPATPPAPNYPLLIEIEIDGN